MGYYMNSDDRQNARSNIQLVNFEENSSVSNNTTNRVSTYILIGMGVLLLVIIIVLVIVVTSRNNKNAEPIPSECTCEIGGAVLAQTQEHKLSLILDWENSICEEPVCLHHTKEFMQPSAIDRDEKDCPDFPKLNASCYQCKDKCLSFDDLKLKKGEKLHCSERVTVDCCLISAIGKLNNYCGDNGQYECFKEDVHEKNNVTIYDPICKCKDGFKGGRCETENKFNSKCKCYNGMLRLKDEDKLKECGNTIESSVNVCSTSITHDNGAFKCVCNTTDSSSDN
ncbi:hypothetical protein ACF0H5_005176 [Mactra antiquata]